ncbi:MAG: hypothetical protein WCK02_09745 [Bacteroidota bacterium]
MNVILIDVFVSFQDDFSYASLILPLFFIFLGLGIWSFREELCLLNIKEKTNYVDIIKSESIFEMKNMIKLGSVLSLLFGLIILFIYVKPQLDTFYNNHIKESKIKIGRISSLNNSILYNRNYIYIKINNEDFAFITDKPFEKIYLDVGDSAKIKYNISKENNRQINTVFELEVVK